MKEDYNHLHLNLTEEEFNRMERRIKLENEDKKEDAQRKMAWFSLLGMLLYPITVILADLIGLSTAATTLGTMASVYFLAVAGIVAAFYGSQAYKSKNNA